MSQLLLPLFPADSHYLTPSIAVYEHDEYVYYLLCGMPIYTHHKDDMTKFRYVTSSLVLQGLCKNSDMAEAFHVSNSSVCKWKKKPEEEGESGFFGLDNRHGHSYKLLPPVLERIQAKLNNEQSVNSIAKEEGISEGSIRYAIKTGTLKKKVKTDSSETAENIEPGDNPEQENNPANQDNLDTVSTEEPELPKRENNNEKIRLITRSERSETDARAIIGIGATMEEERGLACTGTQVCASSRFEAQESVSHGGVLFALPALISQGLDKIFTTFRQLPNGFYGLHHIILLMCFMALCRIKNPEQLKKYPTGEFGKLPGLDRTPQVEYLRVKICQITEQSKCDHVRVYSGSLANLPKHYVSREKLCLTATSEFYVNTCDGLPLMVIIGELNEKLKAAIEKAIIEIKKVTEAKADKTAQPTDIKPLLLPLIPN